MARLRIPVYGLLAAKSQSVFRRTEYLHDVHFLGLHISVCHRYLIWRQKPRSYAMRKIVIFILGIACSVAAVSAQTADELVAKNLAAKGGVEKIKAIKSLK